MLRSRSAGGRSESVPELRIVSLELQNHSARNLHVKASERRDRPMPYTKRFEDALLYAPRLHRDQTRKGTGIPYVTHLLAVAAIVGENGGTEDEVISALLHDAVEDQGGAERRAGRRARVGGGEGKSVGGGHGGGGNSQPPPRGGQGNPS